MDCQIQQRKHHACFATKNSILFYIKSYLWLHPSIDPKEWFYHLSLLRTWYKDKRILSPLFRRILLWNKIYLTRHISLTIVQIRWNQKLHKNNLDRELVWDMRGLFMTIFTLDSTSRITMQINNALFNGFKISLTGIKTTFDLHSSRIFQLEILSLYSFIFNLKTSVSQISDLVRISWRSDNYVGNLFEIRKNVHSKVKKMIKKSVTKWMIGSGDLKMFLGWFKNVSLYENTNLLFFSL